MGTEITKKFLNNCQPSLINVFTFQPIHFFLCEFRKVTEKVEKGRGDNQCFVSVYDTYESESDFFPLIRILIPFSGIAVSQCFCARQINSFFHPFFIQGTQYSNENK